jgi:two-component system nitrogen regulation response regulator NtrX
MSGSLKISSLASKTTSEFERIFDFELLKDARNEFERIFISKKLAQCGNNISRTADMIGVERSNLHRKIKGLEIDA